MIIPPGEVHTGEAVECDLGWDYCAFYPTSQFIDALAADILPGAGNLDFGRDLLRQNTDLADRLLWVNRELSDDMHTDTEPDH